MAKKSIFYLILLVVISVIGLCGCGQGKEQKQSEAEIVAVEETAVEETASGETEADKAAETAADREKLKIIPDIQEICECGVLRVGMMKQEPSIFFILTEDGEYFGIDPTIAKGIAGSMSVELQIMAEYDDYDQLILALQKDEIDMIISNMSLTPARAMSVMFSEPYIIGNASLMLNEEKIITLEVEQNPLEYMRKHPVKIGVSKDPKSTALVEQNFPQAEVVEMDSRLEAAKAVAAGELFGYMSNDIINTELYVQEPTLSLHTKVFVFDDSMDRICVAVAPGKDGLLQFVNGYIIERIHLTLSDVENISKQYYGY